LKEGGLFLAFKSDEQHFWHFYPRIQGNIITDLDKRITEKRKIFNWLKCSQSDYPNPDDLKPVPFDDAIFRVLPTAIDHIMDSFKKQEIASKVKPKLNKLLQKIDTLLKQYINPSLLEKEVNFQIVKQILTVINNLPLKSVNQEIKTIWNNFTIDKKVNILVEELDKLFATNNYYNQLDTEENPIRLIQRENIKLVCYQWFKPEE
jgi:hypothetical protein